MSDIATMQVYACQPQQDKVVTQIGGKAFTMHYLDAFKLSAFMRHAATQAKAWAGDTSMIFTGAATLTDATLDELEAQSRRDGTVYSGKQ